MDKKEYAANWRQKNRERLAYRRQQLREEWRLRLLELIGRSVCKDCGCADVRVLQFDHVEEKGKNVSYYLGRNWDKALEEAARCEVVCANCHVIRTRERLPKFEDVETQWVVNSKDVCKRGHPKTPENYVPTKNTGYCKVCAREKYAERRDQRRRENQGS